MKAVRLYRPRSLREALSDMVASIASIWSEYRIETSHQRSLRRRRRESVRKFEVRVRPGAVPRRSDTSTDWPFVFTLGFMLCGLAVCIVLGFDLWPTIAHAAGQLVARLRSLL